MLKVILRQPCPSVKQSRTRQQRRFLPGTPLDGIISTVGTACLARHLRFPVTWGDLYNRPILNIEA
jgi:hypothetical protein